MGRDGAIKDKVPLIDPVSASARSSTLHHPVGGNRILYKYTSLAVIVLQTTVMVLLLRYSKTQKLAEGKGRYLSSTAIVISEIFKLLVCFAVLAYPGRVNEQGIRCSSGGGLSGLMRILRLEVYGKPIETCKLLVPAGLYTMQNNLLFLALSRLDAATYQVTYQLKILTTAVFSVLLLKRRLSLQQWTSLVMLMVGVALVQLPADYKLGEGVPDRGSGGITLSRLVGLAAVLLASLSSGFAGVFYERLLKRSTQELWVRNTQLALFGILLGAGAVIIVDLERILDRGFFQVGRNVIHGSDGSTASIEKGINLCSKPEKITDHSKCAECWIYEMFGCAVLLQGYNAITWTVILLQTFGGLAVSYATKYADAILKGFATSISIILSTISSWWILNDFEPSVNFFIGTTIVIIATVLFGMPTKK